MERHSRKSEVLPSTKMLPCATICWTKHPENPILGTSWLPSGLQIHSIASTNKLFAPCSWKNTKASEFFQWAFQVSNCCHNGLEFPTKIWSQDLDHKQGNVCRMSSSAPFSHVPSPFLSISASLQEIYHHLGEHLHNRTWLPYLQQLQAPFASKTWMQEVLIGSCQEIKLYIFDIML